MSKLLSAQFTRLKKNKLFWAEMAAMFVFAVVMISTQYREHIQYEVEVSLDSVLFGYAMPMGIIMAVFSSIFLGTEYSDGTIRNKIIIGYSRGNIYFANLITNIAVAFLMCLSYLLAVVAIGLPLIGSATIDTVVILEILLGTLILSVAFCSIFTMISMVYGNKAAVAVISILLVIGLFLFAAYINSRLEAPQYINEYVIDSAGNMQDQPVLNPKYLTGTKRAVYEFLYDFLPTGQSVQYMTMAVKHLWRLPLYSLIITMVTTVTGAAVFKRKDIK